MNLSQNIAEWVGGLSVEDLPPAIVNDVTMRVLDTVGISVAAVGAGPAIAARVAALKLCAGGPSRMLGYGDAVAPAWAAMVNGTMAHALDLDDTHPGASIHVSSPVVSAVISLGDALGSHGRDVLTAVACGGEIAARIGRVAPGGFQARGFHATGILGTIGAAVATGRLLGLNVDQFRHAIGISVSQASGISESFGDGTWPRRLHPGWAAHSGISAAYLAQAGFTGPEGALDGRFGLFKAFLGEREQPYDRILDGLGAEWFASKAAFKPYPCGHIIQGFVDCMIALYHERGVRAEGIERITCRVSPWMIPLIAEPESAKRRPVSESGAKGSLYYTVAATIGAGRLTAAAYEDHRLAAPDMLALIDKVVCVPDPDPPETRRYKGWVIVETTSGDMHEIVIPDSLGSAANPMSSAAIQQKLREATAEILPAVQADRLIAEALELPSLPDIRSLVDLCQVPAT